MATLALQNMEIVGHSLGTNIVPIPYTEGVAQGFAVGGVVTNLAGQAIAAIDGVLTTILMGITKSAASGVTNDPITILPFLPGTVIRATLEDDGTPGHVLVQLDIGRHYALGVNGANFYLDENNLTVEDAFARVIRIDEGSALGDVRARVYAVVIASFFTVTGA